MRPSLQHLWTHIDRRTYIVNHILLSCSHTKSQISDLHFQIAAQEDILSLQIPMNKIFSLQFNQSPANLLNYFPNKKST